jgi:hypothetical protein
MEWIEDNRSFQGPSSESKSKSKNTDESIQQDGNAWDIDYRTLRSQTNENDPSPTDPALAPNSLKQNAHQFIERNKQTDTPDYNTSSQNFLDSYMQNGQAPINLEGEQFSANLNQDLPNNVDTTDNNNFANGTFDPVNKAGEAAQNFLANKKNLVLNNFK